MFLVRLSWENLLKGLLRPKDNSDQIAENSEREMRPLRKAAATKASWIADGISGSGR